MPGMCLPLHNAQQTKKRHAREPNFAICRLKNARPRPGVEWQQCIEQSYSRYFQAPRGRCCGGATHSSLQGAAMAFSKIREAGGGEAGRRLARRATGSSGESAAAMSSLDALFNYRVVETELPPPPIACLAACGGPSGGGGGRAPGNGRASCIPAACGWSPRLCSALPLKRSGCAWRVATFPVSLSLHTAPQQHAGGAHSPRPLLMRALYALQTDTPSMREAVVACTPCCVGERLS